MKRGAVSRHRSKISRELNALSNPFDTDTKTEEPVVDPENGWTADEAAAVGSTEELDEIDTPEALDDEAEDTVTPEAAATAGEGAKPEKAPKAPARPTPPEGLITPVQFAKELTKHLEAQGKSNKNGPITSKSAESPGNPIPPQYIYSMLSQSAKAGAKNPIPTYVADHQGNVFSTAEAPKDDQGNLKPLARVNLLKLDEALKWWDEKDARVSASKQAKAEKAAKAAEKASETPAPVEAEAVTETEPVEEAE